MDLPDPDAAEDLIEYLNSRALNADGWSEVAAALREREQSTGDIQAGWLMTAFDYGLARRVGEGRTEKGAFGEQVSAAPGPTPLLSSRCQPK